MTSGTSYCFSHHGYSIGEMRNGKIGARRVVAGATADSEEGTTTLS